jgi:hypothetical protein
MSEKHAMRTRSQTKSARLGTEQLSAQLNRFQLRHLRTGMYWTKGTIKKWAPRKGVRSIAIVKKKSIKQITLWRTVLKLKLWNGRIASFKNGVTFRKRGLLMKKMVFRLL